MSTDPTRPSEPTEHEWDDVLHPSANGIRMKDVQRLRDREKAAARREVVAAVEAVAIRTESGWGIDALSWNAAHNACVRAARSAKGETT